MGLLQSSPRHRGRLDREGNHSLEQHHVQGSGGDRSDHASGDVHRRDREEMSSRIPPGDGPRSAPERKHASRSSSRQLQARTISSGDSQVQPQGRCEGQPPNFRRGLGQIGGVPAMRQQMDLGKDRERSDRILGTSGTTSSCRRTRTENPRRSKAIQGAVSLLAAAGCLVSQLVPDGSISDSEFFSCVSSGDEPADLGTGSSGFGVSQAADATGFGSEQQQQAQNKEVEEDNFGF